MDLFRVRLNCVDHYQATPTDFDPKLPRTHKPSQPKILPKVPVIRVFGATETGQKVCAHIHGAFPYLYIQYNGSLAPRDGKIPQTRLLLLSNSSQWTPMCTKSISPLTMHWLSATAATCTMERRLLLRILPL